MRLETVYLEVAASSLEALKEFYGKTLGLELVSEEPGESIWFQAGAVRIGFHDTDPPPADAGTVNLSFAVPDADAEADRLTALGITIAQGPFTAPWNGGRVAVVQDPAGHTVWLSGPPGHRT